LKQLQKEGKVRFFGVSTPEHDQNALIGLMRAGYVDVVQVIYNIFEQEPAAEFLPAAQENDVGVIVRMAFDEGVLTGKYAADHRFPEGDFRNNYFDGDRLQRAVFRADRIKEEVADSGYTMPQVALKFCLAHPATSTVIAGMRKVYQANDNIAVSDMDDLPPDLLNRLHDHAWRRAFWYEGK
jgi:aryl-alcohol dehydrogenase-like predicted oxidoreductase